MSRATSHTSGFLVLWLLFAACKSPDSTSQSLEAPTASELPKASAGIEILFARFAEKPRTYPALVNGISAMTGAARFETLIPKGRSLQRDKVNFTEPRVVAAFHNQPAPKWPIPKVDGRLFLGFSAIAKQAEVISWNEDLQQFDFFILKNLGNTAEEPFLEKQNRDACIPCHQNQGPIFTPANWPETNAMNGFTRSQLAAHHGDGAYWYVPINISSDVVERLQRVVENATTILTLAGSCRDYVCKDDAACWYEYLKSAILIHDQWSRDPKFKNYVDLPKIGRSIISRWPRAKKMTFVSPLLEISVNGGIGNDFPASLASQGPVTKSDVEKTLTLDPKKPRNTKELKMVSDFELSTEATDANYTDVAVKFLGANGMTCTGLSTFDAMVLETYSLDQLSEAMAKPTFRDFAQASPRAGARPTMRRLLLDLGVAEAEIPAQYYSSSLQNDGIGQAAVDYSTKPTGEIMDHFCSPCHGGDDPTGGSLPLGDLTRLKAFVSPSYGTSVRDIIAAGTMPPLNAERLAKIGWTVQVRAKVVNALQ